MLATIVFPKIYPPTIISMVIKGPTHANVYCARPPVRFGISALSSAIAKAAKQLSIHAKIIDMIKGVPIVPAPCPRDKRQLVATITPTPVAITLNKPNFFFSSISSPPISEEHLHPLRLF